MRKSKTTTLGEGRFLRLVSRDTYEYVERVNATAVVCIAAITQANKLIFIEQYRHAVDARTIELVAGLVGDIEANESMETAARRELEEESGYAAEDWECLMTGPSAGGMSSSMVTFYLAQQLHRVGPGGGVDEHEDLTVHEVPLREVSAWLREQEISGKLVDPKVFVGIYAIRERRPEAFA